MKKHAHTHLHSHTHGNDGCSCSGGSCSCNSNSGGGCACNTVSTAKFSFAQAKGELSVIFVAVLLLIAGVFISIEGAEYINIALFISAYLICGGEFLLKAAKNISRGQIFDENFLMALATVCALLLGEYAEGVAVMLFYRTGEFFQELAVRRTRRSVKELINLRPDYAVIIKDGQEQKVEPESVAAGDIIIVRPGEKVPVDCLVLSGSAYIDSSAITGESVPRSISAGDKVYSGVINKDGVITARAENVYLQSTASKILQLVETAAAKKAPAENFITKFSKIYTPVVVALAALVAIVPPLFLGAHTYGDWVYKALIFLIMSCPCALVISIPLGFFGGIGGASARGILFKGANYLDALTNLSVVVTDKTGTLTKGVFKVNKIVPAKGVNADELIGTAASAEKYSNHPIAQSLLAYYGKPPAGSVQNYREISGKGVSADIDGQRVLAGSYKLMESGAAADTFEYGTVVHVEKGGRYLGYIIISDELKEGAENFVSRLKSVGVERVVMLTGDNEQAAKHAAEKLSITEYRSGLTPIDKTFELERIMADSGKVTAFIGDGVNDSPVLARADIGIAMGAIGSDAAIESADIVLMNDSLDSVVTAVKIAKRTRRIVLQNVVLAIAFKLAVMTLGLFGLANMWLAIFADVGVALLAVLNSTRALMTKKL